jgi:ubiquitin-protein ligase
MSSIIALLSEPDPFLPLEEGIATQYLENKEEFDLLAREVTLKYAHGDFEDEA